MDSIGVRVKKSVINGERLFAMDKSALNRFFSNECTTSERADIVSWLLDPSNDIMVTRWMRENWDLISNLDYDHTDGEPDVNKIWSSIREKISQEKPLQPFIEDQNTPTFSLRNNFRRVLSIAAIFIVLLVGAVYLYPYLNAPKKELTKAQPHSNTTDIAPPANNKAVLTLADGKKIILDNSGEGILAKEGEVNVTKAANDELVYNGSANNKVEYNTLSLPKGSKPIRLVLADGSLVWLNAASSVTYPTAFVGTERKVRITGEAYFEVAKNAAMPFYVSHDDGAMIKVLGTHFNVNAYDDEKEIRVTLLEGSVNVSNAGKSSTIKPGEQAQITKGNIATKSGVDIEEVMAWKNGQFYFNGTDLKTIMRQIEKYYDVEVEYRDNVKYQFYAKIDRQVNVSEFLKKLELTNLVHFKIESNKIIVMK